MADCPFCTYQGDFVYHTDHRSETEFAICPKCHRAHEVK